MAHHADIKTTFEADRVIQPIYTGGSVALSEDGTVLATCLGEEALLTDLDTGRHLCRIEGDGEPITTLVLSPDSSWLVVCSRSLAMRVYALRSADTGIEAKLARNVKPHSTPVVTCAVDSTSSLVATGGADGEVKVWDLRAGYTTHTFHGHSGLISALHFFEVDPTEPTPKSKKRKSRQMNEDDAPTSDGATAGYRLASGGEDGKVRVWDLHKRRSVATLDSHASVVRSLDYCKQQARLISGSRDRTAISWSSKTWEAVSIVPVLESIETAGFLNHGAFFFTGGENGRLRIWSTLSGEEITEDQEPGVETEAILDVLHFDNLPFLVSVHADQTLIAHALDASLAAPSQRIPPLPVIRRISGTHDEVIDLAYIGAQRNILALATNLEDIRLISLASEQSPESSASYFGADVALLKGHSDIIITIDTDWSGHWLATGAKDNTARLWRLDPANDSYSCYATFTGHAESISAVALPKATPQVGSNEYNHPLEHPPRYVITGSQDKTVKRWEVPSKSGKTARAVYTRKAHDKDINAIETSFSSTSPLFASASQDRTVKIWDVEAGEAIGVLRGHKRGVWSVAFSPPGMPALTLGDSGGASSAKGMVVTGSGDKSVRIWSLTDYSCLRTFEGHVNSVLKVIWLPVPGRTKTGKATRGVQVASAAGDGLVKVWDAQDSECAATLDNHIDRVWALAVKPDPILTLEEQQKRRDTNMVDDEVDGDAQSNEHSIELVSGSADSTLTFWRDTTASTAQRATTKATARIEQDQELQNYMRARNYREAIVLALQLDHPKRLLDLFGAVASTSPPEPGSYSGARDVDAALADLSDAHLWALLRRLRDWNANARAHRTAQRLLYALLRLHSKDRLLGLQRRELRHRAHRSGGGDELVAAMASLDTTPDSTVSSSGGARQKDSIKDVLDALRAYPERHATRLERASEERFVLAWALQQMGEDGAGGEALVGA